MKEWSELTKMQKEAEIRLLLAHMGQGRPGRRVERIDLPGGDVAIIASDVSTRQRGRS